MKGCNDFECAIFNEVGYSISHAVKEHGIYPKKNSLWLRENHYRNNPYRVWWDFGWGEIPGVEDCNK